MVLPPQKTRRHLTLRILTAAQKPLPCFRHRRRSASFQLTAKLPLAEICSLTRSTLFIAKQKTTADAVAFVLAPQTGLEPVTLRLTAACSTDWAIRAYIYVHWSSAQRLFSGTALLWLQWTKFRIRQRLTLPGRLQPSTISAEKLNFCVRHGNRWSFSPLSPEILTAFSLFLSSFSMHLHNRRSPI